MSIKKNTTYNLVGAIVPLAVTFIALPLYLGAVGDERYGILAIIWTLLGYFGLFDAGLGRATSNQIAKLASAPPEQREELFWTALLLNLGLGLVGGIALWVAGAQLFDRFILVPPNLKGEMSSSLVWLALSLPITTVAGVLGGALQGREVFLAINGVRIVDQALNQLFPLAVVYLWGPNLNWLIASVVCVRLLTALASFVLCVRNVPIRHGPRFERSHVPHLMTYGGWVTVTSIVSPLLSVLDRFLIGAVAGARAVTYYTVPYSLACRVTLLPGSLSSALFPRFSSQTSAERDELMTESIRALLVIVTPAVLIGILVMHPFLGWWVSPEFAAHAGTPGEILALGLWFNSLALIAFTRLQAQGQPDVVAKFHILELIPYLGLLWYAVNDWGIVGAAMVWSIRVAVDAGLLSWAAGMKIELWLRMVPPILILAVGAVVAFLWPSHGFTYWAVSTVLLALAVTWAWTAAPSSVRRLVKQFFTNSLPIWLRKAIGHTP